MIKRITKTKQMRLDELIKYIFENNIKNKCFCSEQKKTLEVDIYGKIIPRAHFNKNSIFPVEIEEEITEDTEFEQGVVVLKYGAIITFSKSSFGYLKQRYAGQQFKIYVFIDGGLELIWESEEK